MREERIGDCRLILGDCAKILPMIGRVDCVVTDPPYGIGESSKKVASRGKMAKPKDYGDFDWDASPASAEVIAMIRDISRHQIIFGGNFFDLPPTSCWLIWDKENGANDFADCEMAWTNLPKAVRRIRFHWNGCMRKERDIPREHPTQKPIGVMEWCISHLPEGASTILDPFMGSGTTLVACANLGRRGIGIEIDEKYHSIACRRIEAAYAQPRLFDEPAPKAAQMEMVA